MTETTAQRKARRSHDKALVIAIKTLALYANPSSYHAMSFMADRPAGWFADDFDQTKQYKRKMPGKAARKAIEKIRKLLTPA